jgi:hypothetical protein
MRSSIILTVLLFTAHWSLAGSTNPVHEFLNALDDEQKEQVLLTLDDASREKWHYFPASMWPRPGITLGALDDHQRALFNVLLQHSLSASGYHKTQRIIELEMVLRELGGDPGMRDPGAYYIAFYGDPFNDAAWGWSFEGHHLSLNFTVVGSEVAMAPRFLGANPATIPEGSRKGERALAAEEDLAFALINTLSDVQRAKAVFSDKAPSDIITGNDSEVAPLEDYGITVSELNAEQEKLLTDLLAVYLSIMPTDLAIERMQHLRAEDFSAIRFAWAGSLTPDKPHYFRIQGKTFLIEYDNIQNNANHIHTVWRDFDGDFGRDLLREHYEHEH